MTSARKDLIAYWEPSRNISLEEVASELSRALKGKKESPRGSKVVGAGGEAPCGMLTGGVDAWESGGDGSQLRLRQWTRVEVDGIQKGGRNEEMFGRQVSKRSDR